MSSSKEIRDAFYAGYKASKRRVGLKKRASGITHLGAWDYNAQASSNEYAIGDVFDDTYEIVAINSDRYAEPHYMVVVYPDGIEKEMNTWELDRMSRQPMF